MSVEMTVHRIDVDKSTADGRSPALVLPNSGPGWLVSTKPIIGAEGKPIEELFSACQGDYAICPLIPYLVKADPVSAMGMNLQLGFLISRLIPNATKLTIGLGYPMEVVRTAEHGDLYRLWLGFAVFKGVN